MKKGILFLWAVVIFSACCDDVLPPVNNCETGIAEYTIPALEVSDSSILACIDCPVDCQETYSPTVPFDYYYPCFNPRNAEQIAYYQYDNTLGQNSSELWVVDFCTGEKEMIANNAYYGLDWSVKNWLVYTGEDQSLWKVKANGDSLTQLTFSGDFNRYPEWSPKGDRILYNKSIGANSYYLLVNENGIALDTLNALGGAAAWSWINEEQICFLVADEMTPFTTNLNYYTLSTEEVTHLHQLTNQNNNDLLIVNTAASQEDNSVYWCARGAIGKTDLSTGNYEVLRERLVQEHFEFLTLRPGHNELVFSKNTRTYQEYCEFDTEYGFFMIDRDGRNQREVILP